MSFAIRSLIARNAKLNGISIDLESKARHIAYKHKEAKIEDISRVTLTMALDEGLHPTWHTVKAWKWHEHKSPVPLPKTTREMKDFVRNYRGWGE